MNLFLSHTNIVSIDHGQSNLIEKYTRIYQCSRGGKINKEKLVLIRTFTMNMNFNIDQNIK